MTNLEDPDFPPDRHTVQELRPRDERIPIKGLLMALATAYAIGVLSGIALERSNADDASVTISAEPLHEFVPTDDLGSGP